MLHRPQAPFQCTWLPLQGLLKCGRCLLHCHHPKSVAAALPKASKVGSVHRRHASAPIHHLPGWWVCSLSSDRQLPLTMGETAALPPRLWQQEKKILQKEYVKLLQILDATAIMPPHS